MTGRWSPVQAASPGASLSNSRAGSGNSVRGMRACSALAQVSTIRHRPSGPSWPSCFESPVWLDETGA